MNGRCRFSYANIAASLALFVALAGGAAFAADKIGSKDIAKNAVKSKHVRNGQIRSADVAAGAINASHLAADAGVVTRCGPGAVAGAATVDAQGGIGAEFAAAGITGFSCAGGPVTVRHDAEGVYTVCFGGAQGLEVAVANSIADSEPGTDNFVSVKPTQVEGCAGWAVEAHVLDQDEAPQDTDFAVLATSSG